MPRQSAIVGEARFTDPRILNIADRITIRQDADIERDFPDKFRCRVTFTLRDGTTRSAGLDYPRGHHADPMSDAEVEAKFRSLAATRLSPPRIDALLGALWTIEQADGPSGIFKFVTAAAGESEVR